MAEKDSLYLLTGLNHPIGLGATQVGIGIGESVGSSHALKTSVAPYHMVHDS